jgi:hypothetical protein
VTTWRTGFESRQGQEHFLFSSLSRPVVGPTQSTSQWEQGWGGSFAGMKLTGRDVDRTHIILR